jgi:4-hydroxyproline epimerase
MCGHGTIGLLATLEHLGRVQPGTYGIDTPVGTVQVQLHGQGAVSVANVPAYRHRAGVELEVPGHGTVRGDVAWGGNWFFLCSGSAQPPLRMDAVDALTRFASAIRRQLQAQGITGHDGADIDHVELLGPPEIEGNSGRNFVLCPGGAYDRSPCGTGTSAKLACLAADGALQEGVVWRQESVLGSVFEASFRRAGGQVLPTIRGQAHICAELSLLLDPRDPFCWGTAQPHP